MGYSWSKHSVLHIILWQSPTAVISLRSRWNSCANFLIHLTRGCLTGSVLAKLMSSHLNSIYNSWDKHFFSTHTHALSHVNELNPSSPVCIANNPSLTVAGTHFWGKELHVVRYNSLVLKFSKLRAKLNKRLSFWFNGSILLKASLQVCRDDESFIWQALPWLCLS